MAVTTTIEGNITNEPELKYFPSGKCVLNLGIAVNSGVRNASGEWTDRTDFFDTSVWDRQAENAYESLTKGMTVIVTGNLRQRSFETNGQRRSKIELSVTSIGPSLKWATANVTKNPKRSAEQADESGEGAVLAEEPPAEAVDPMSAPF